MKNLLIIFIALLTQTVFAQDTQVYINVKNLSKKWVFKDVINPEKTQEELAEMRDLLGPTILQLHADGSYA
jgi:hypothetical protein